MRKFMHSAVLAVALLLAVVCVSAVSVEEEATPQNIMATVDHAMDALAAHHEEMHVDQSEQEGQPILDSDASDASDSSASASEAEQDSEDESDVEDAMQMRKLSRQEVALDENRPVRTRTQRLEMMYEAMKRNCPGVHEIDSCLRTLESALTCPSNIKTFSGIKFAQDHCKHTLLAKYLLEYAATYFADCAYNCPAPEGHRVQVEGPHNGRGEIQDSDRDSDMGGSSWWCCFWPNCKRPGSK